jgi:AraC-like DNA-binding protein
MKILTDLNIFNAQHADIFQRHGYFVNSGMEKPDNSVLQVIPAGAEILNSYGVCCTYAIFQRMTERYFARRNNQDFYSLEYVVAGSAYYRCGNFACRADAGEAILLHPGYNCEILHPRDAPPCTSYGFILRGTILNEIIHGLHLDGAYAFIMRNPQQFEEECVNLQNAVRNWDSEAGRSELAAMTFKILQILAWENSSENKASPLASNLRQILENNYAQPLNMKKVAESLNVSVPTASNYFKHDYGMTPFQYLKRIRLGRALPLLRQPQMQIKQIAYAVGFPSIQHFILEFHKFYGMTPGEYRRNTLK